jgi:solute:Na+ symporter, SSS family
MRRSVAVGFIPYVLMLAGIPFFNIVVAAVVIGFAAHGRSKIGIEEWTVGGRRYGGVLLWVLAAGEIYTTFTYLGAAGYAYANGGPVFYILGYGALAYIISFFLLPPLWRYAKRNGLLTQAGYFTSRFGSRWVGALAAVIGVVFVVPTARCNSKALVTS